MKPLAGALTLMVIVSLLARHLFARGRQEAPSDQKELANVGRELRRKMLTTPPEQIGVRPTKDFPKVYAVLLDWPVGDHQVVTIFAACDGAASLYTTSTFGIVGGEAHASVREAAKAFVHGASDYFDEAKPVTEYPYPGEGRLRFYLLTFDGVRVIDADLSSVGDGKDRYSNLFAAGQAVLSELRKFTEGTP